MYTIKLIDSTISASSLVPLLTKALEKDGRFTAKLTPDGEEIGVQKVRLTVAKPYCGQHPGECVLGGPKRKARFLEWEDWVAFHALVNDVLDAWKVGADVWSTPLDALDKGRKMWIRRGTARRVRYEWEEGPGRFGGRVRIWNHGTPDQFEA